MVIFILITVAIAKLVIKGTIFLEDVFVNFTTRWQLLPHWVFVALVWCKTRMCV